MSTAIIAIVLVFAFLIGGMITLLNSANKFKLPDNYDKSKTGFDDEDDWPEAQYHLDKNGKPSKDSSSEK